MSFLTKILPSGLLAVGLHRELLGRAVAGGFLKVAATALAFIVTVVLARTMGPDNFGAYSYAIALVTLLAVPAQVGLPGVVVRVTAEAVALGKVATARSVWRWASSVAGGLSALLVGLVVILVICIDLAPAGLSKKAMLSTVLLVPIFALSNVRAAALRGLGHTVVSQAPEMIVRPLVMLLCVLIAVTLFPAPLSTELGIQSHVISAATALIFGVAYLWCVSPAEAAQHSPSQEERLAWLRSAAIFAALGFAQIGIQQIDILILGAYAGPTEVAQYRVATQSAALVAFGYHAVNMVVPPYIARLWAQTNLRQAWQLVALSGRISFLLGLPVFLAYLALGSQILNLAFGADFQGSLRPLLILSAAQLFNAAVGPVGVMLNMTGHERDTLRGVFAAAIVNVCLGFAVIPTFGLIGAALSSAMTIIVWNIILWTYARRRVKALQQG